VQARRRGRRTQVRPPLLAVPAQCTGVGIDLVALDEFAEVFERRVTLRRVFTRQGLAYCMARPRATQHLAARFAAKEAAFKAVGTGWAHGVTWRDAEVVSQPGAPPSLVMRGELARRAKALGDPQAQVSLTHSGGYAAAIVMLIARPAAARGVGGGR
jgi:holo-[acyl-carrier protein] synthase